MEVTKNTTYLEQAWERHSAAISVMNENNRTSEKYIAFLADWAVDALPFEAEEEDEEFEK